MLEPVYYTELSHAVRDVRLGQHWGVLHFKENFTDAFYERMFGLAELKIPDNATLDASEVHVQLDMTNQQVRTRSIYLYPGPNWGLLTPLNHLFLLT